MDHGNEDFVNVLKNINENKTNEMNIYFQVIWY